MRRGGDMRILLHWSVLTGKRQETTGPSPCLYALLLLYDEAPALQIGERAPVNIGVWSLLTYCAGTSKVGMTPPLKSGLLRM